MILESTFSHQAVKRKKDRNFERFFQNDESYFQKKLLRSGAKVDGLPMDLSIVMEVFQTLEDFSKNGSYCRFIKDAMGTIHRSHMMFDDIQ